MLGLSKAIFPAWELNFEFLVLCCLQPLGCVMCKKYCNYRETFGAMQKHFFNPKERDCFLRMFAGMRARKKTRFSCIPDMWHSQLFTYVLQDLLHSRMAPYNCLLSYLVWHFDFNLAWNTCLDWECCWCIFMQLFIVFDWECGFSLLFNLRPSGVNRPLHPKHEQELARGCADVSRLHARRFVLDGWHAAAAGTDRCPLRGLQGLHRGVPQQIHLSVQECLLWGVFWLHY